MAEPDSKPEPSLPEEIIEVPSPEELEEQIHGRMIELRPIEIDLRPIETDFTSHWNRRREWFRSRR